MPRVNVGGEKIPAQIWVIPSQFINPKFGETLDKAIEHYVYKRGNKEAIIKPEDIVMFTFPNPHNTFTGFSSIRGVAEEAYISNQMNEFEKSILENRARVGGVIEETEDIGDADRTRIKEKLKQDHTGPKKAGKRLYLPRGLKYTPDVMTPNEINFVEGRKLIRTICLAALDVPEALVVSESSNRAVAEEASYQHAKNGILPRCRKIEEKINERIMPLYDDKLFVAFDDPVPENRELKLKEEVEHSKSNIRSIN